jgi:hypothetical protein
MANKRQMIINRLWEMKKAAQEIDMLYACEDHPEFDCVDNCMLGYDLCGTIMEAKNMEIPEE